LERKGLVEMAMDKMDVFLLRAHVVGHAHGGHKSTTQAAMCIARKKMESARARCVSAGLPVFAPCAP